MMRLIKIILCCCCVFSGHFSNGSSIHSSEIKSHLINHTMELIDKGFANNSNPLIISSDLVDDQVASENVDSGKPLIVINSDQKRKQIEGYLPSHPTYILRYESLPKLTSLIFGFMRSSTCNIKSPIFLLDVSEGTHDMDASIALGFLASLDILISYYVSYDDKKDSTMVYTLNPYTQYAPSPWNQVKFANAKSNSKTKATLYNLQYPKDLNYNCKNIHFDKTEHLEGHEIKLMASTIQKNLSEEYTQRNIIEYMEYLKKFKDNGLNSLPDYMNVTTSIQILENNFKGKNIKYGFDGKLVNRQYDARNLMTQLADTNPKLTDFVTEYREWYYSILTKKTDYLLANTEIDINLWFILITLFVLMLIAMVIIINNKFNVSEGIMDIVSMSLSMGIMSSMGRLSMRIIYFFGFLFIFVVMPEFQGQISAILSQPARRNVETLKDLFDNQYHVYYDGLLENDMIIEKLWVTEEDQKYLHPSRHSDLNKCMKEAQQNPTIACIDSTKNQLRYALKLQNLYVSKEITFKKYFVFWTKKNWALKDKIDKVRSIPVETGLIYHYNEEIIKNLWKRKEKMEKIKENENYERIDFDNLVFYFIMFAATLLWSLIIFEIELIVHYYHSKYQRQEKERRQFIKRLRAQPRIILPQVE
ncbi:GSCOCG00009596001-RA-CDS [Cotesia congregata]|nr:GSCOCG00009596001-RA-CDS [Cotesia congregata]